MALRHSANLHEFVSETSVLAAQELDSRQGAALRVSVKADSSLVTEADLASERLILERIKRYYPNDRIYSEESGLSAIGRPTGGYIWIVDPLDGTTNYANGYPFYCISIGRGRFLADGSIEMLAGGVFDVPRKRLYYAERQKGAWVDGRRLQVATARPFANAFLITGFYYQQGDVLQREIERFAHIASQCQTIRRDGAAALDLALAAEGIADAFWEHGLQPWDVAAGSLLVAEAGGAVANYQSPQGAYYNIEGTGIVAGSPDTVSKILSLL